MARKTLQQLCEDRYDDPVIAAAVTDDAIAQGTADKILAGHSVLPSAQDAQHWYDRKTGVAGLNPDQRRQQDRIKALEQLVFELHAQSTSPTPERQEALSERIQALKEGGD